MYVIYLKVNSSYLPIPAEAAPGEASFIPRAERDRSSSRSSSSTGLDLTGPFVQLDRSSRAAGTRRVQTGLDPVALRRSLS